MKKTRLWLLALLLALIILPAKAETGYGVVYNSSMVNLREQPTQYSDWLGAYASGKWVQIHGESGNWFRAASLSRVTIEEVNGQPFDPDAVYAVITSNANAKGGMDASYVFRSVAELEDEKTVVTTAVVRDVIWMYLAGELGNVISEPYAQAQDRITVK